MTPHVVIKEISGIKIYLKEGATRPGVLTGGLGACLLIIGFLMCVRSLVIQSLIGTIYAAFFIGAAFFTLSLFGKPCYEISSDIDYGFIVIKTENSKEDQNKICGFVKKLEEGALEYDGKIKSLEEIAGNCKGVDLR
jgi:hypothetical protein